MSFIGELFRMANDHIKLAVFRQTPPPMVYLQPERHRGPPQMHEIVRMRRCNRLKKSTLNNDYAVRFMARALARIGCPVDLNQMVLCAHCDSYETGIGGITVASPSQSSDPESKDSGMHHIVMASDGIHSQKTFATTLTHELVHLYDYCRADLDKDNLHHAACTEIRAANLSRDCTQWSEFFRGNGNTLTNSHHFQCVKRRALLSVMGQPGCKDMEMAKQAIEDVWDICVKDLAPFGEIPYGWENDKYDIERGM